MIELTLVDEGKCRASGTSDLATGRADRDATANVLGTAITNGQRSIEIDVSGIENGNSMVLSLMLTWLRLARCHDVSVRFTGMTSALLELVRFTGLDDVLPYKEVS